MGGNELEVLSHYNRKILKYPDDSELLMRCLGKLEAVKVNIQLLQDTGIGRTIGLLKKQHVQSEIGEKARDLVLKWKNVVRSEEENHVDENAAPATEEDEEEAGGEEEETKDTQQVDDVPSYVPTPLAPSYVPTPIGELADSRVKEEPTDESNNGLSDEPTGALSDEPSYRGGDLLNSKRENSPRKSHKHKKSSRDDKDEKNHREVKDEKIHREIKDEKNHREVKDEHRLKDEGVRDKEHKSSKKHKEKDRERSDTKERGREREREKEKERSERKEHKSSKSSRKDKDRPKEERDRHKEDREIKKERHSGDKEKNCDKTKDEPRIKTEIKSEPVEPTTTVSRIKDEPLEPALNGESSHTSNHKEKERREKDKERDRHKEKHKKKKDRAPVEDDMFAKAMGGLPDFKEKSRKRPKESSHDEVKRKERKIEHKSHRESSSDMMRATLPSSSLSATLPSSSLSIPPPSYNPTITPSSFLPEISPMYKPLPRPPLESRHHQSDDEALGILMGQKKTKSTIYSGKKRKRFFDEVPSLYQQCIMILQEHVDDIDEVGNLSYDVLEPVLNMAKPKTLLHIENLNEHIMTGPTNTSTMWEKHCKRDFRTKTREEFESWREMYERCTDEQAQKLQKLKGKAKENFHQERSARRETKIAFPDMVAKPPRDVAKRQERNGTGLPVGHVSKVGAPRPRVQDPTAGNNRPQISRRPKAPPMMAKVKTMMKGMTKFGRR